MTRLHEMWFDSAEDQALYICWRGAVASAIRGKRGQAFLRELRDALDAMPDKRLVENDFIRADGACCALGVVAQLRGLTAEDLPHPDDVQCSLDELGGALGIAGALAAEIMWENDEGHYGYMQFSHITDPDERRWHQMMAWVESKITDVRGPNTSQQEGQA